MADGNGSTSTTGFVTGQNKKSKLRISTSHGLPEYTYNLNICLCGSANNLNIVYVAEQMQRLQSGALFQLAILHGSEEAERSGADEKQGRRTVMSTDRAEWRPL